MCPDAPYFVILLCLTPDILLIQGRVLPLNKLIGLSVLASVSDFDNIFTTRLHRRQRIFGQMETKKVMEMASFTESLGIPTHCCRPYLELHLNTQSRSRSTWLGLLTLATTMVLNSMAYCHHAQQMVSA
jgi:hypothetical protein